MSNPHHHHHGCGHLEKMLWSRRELLGRLGGGFPVTPPVSLGFLVGDVNNLRSVNASDISAVKARRGQVINTTNFKFDLDASGDIDDTDLTMVKGRAGLSFP